MKSQKPQMRNSKTSRRNHSVLAIGRKLVHRMCRSFSTTVLLLPPYASQRLLQATLLRVVKMHRKGYRVRVMLMPSQCNNAEIQRCWLLSEATQEHSGCPLPKVTNVEATHIASLLAAARVLLFHASKHLCPYAVTPNETSSPAAGGKDAGAEKGRS